MSAPPVKPFESSKKVSDAFTVSGVADEDVIKLASENGYKSVLNLRNNSEPGYYDEEPLVRKYGLEYAHSPVLANPTSLNYESVVKAANVLHELPTPVYIHCSHGSRAALVALVHDSIYSQKKSADEIIKSASELGWNYGDVWKETIAKEHQ